MFPRVEVDADVLFIDDGDVLTSAGVAAGIDLCLHTVRRDHGTAIADEVARRTVVPPHRDGGQAQYIHRPVPAPQQASTAAARAWALGRLHEPIQLRDMAEQEAMSVRTFTRRFREEVGGAPASGSPSSVSNAPGTCWSPPTCPSTRWPGTPASAPPSRCGSTYRRRSASPPPSYRRPFRAGTGHHVNTRFLNDT